MPDTFKVKWGDDITTMERISSKSTGYTYYDKYRFEDGTEFGMHRDHFQTRAAKNSPVLFVSDKPILVLSDASPTNAEETLGVIVKSAEWSATERRKPNADPA